MTIIVPNPLRGFEKLKKNPKIREKLGSGWVGQAPTRIINFFENVVFLCVFCVVFLFPNVSKKKKMNVGGGGGGGRIESD